VIKAVSQNYEPSGELLSLLDAFRLMTNSCIRIGLEEGVTSLKSLSLKAYHRLRGFDVPSYYKLCAISHAVGILRSYRRASRSDKKPKIPFSSRPMLVTCYGFKIVGDKLRLPLRPSRCLWIALNHHTVQTLSAPGLSVRSVCVTTRTVGIAFSKEVVETKPEGLIGMDRNLDNVTVASSDGSSQIYDLSKATEIKARYREVRSHFKRNDVRVRRCIFSKYGKTERCRVTQLIHLVSKDMVRQAKARRFGIAMEKLTGIRRLYRKGKGQGRDYRFRMNSWSYGELQKQIDYKARWEGIKVVYVAARGTSAKCSTCGSKLNPNGRRTLYCPKCSISVDRDLNAAKNILARGLRFGPIALPSEAMMEGPPQGAILRVDGSELGHEPRT